MSRATCATIHLAALRENLKRVRTLAPNSKVMAVVKADGYGHGLERVAQALNGADAFGVASIADGERIRAVGLSNRVVVLTGIDEAADLPEMRRLDLETVIHHDSQIDLLDADRDPRPLRVWLKLDTGMHRLGFALERAATVYRRLSSLHSVAPGIALLTHFANSDVFDDDLTERQTQRFAAVADRLEGVRSLANSAAILGWPAAHADWVRAGGVLYGIAVVEGKTGADFGFHPAMTLATRLIAINRVCKGERIGYGATWECPEDMNVGVAAIGYGDGYPRNAPAGTPVLINGQRAAIIGRVSMDLMTVDLRTHADAKVGDAVVLWGAKLPVEEIAERAGTIGYELVCGMTRRVNFVEDGAAL